jgi:hypothetical protein
MRSLRSISASAERRCKEQVRLISKELGKVGVTGEMERGGTGEGVKVEFGWRERERTCSSDRAGKLAESSTAREEYESRWGMLL